MVESMAPGAERRHLAALLTWSASEPMREGAATSSTEGTCALIGLAGHLEATGRMEEAAAALDLAAGLEPADPELLLHRARIARKSGQVAEARSLYDRIAAVEGGTPCLACMALVGHALLSPDPEQALGRAIRASVVRHEPEAAAVAQEARARARRARGDVSGALRDYAVAAARFDHPADRGRIGHEAADFLLSIGDGLAARRVLIEVERSALAEQAAWARARLLHLSRAISDQLGTRRWAGAGTPALVSLAPRLRGGGDRSREALVERLIARFATR